MAGAGHACWEVLSSNVVTVEEAAIEVVAAYESDLDGGLPAAGVARAEGGLGPFSTSAIGGDATIPIPRFVDGALAEDLFVVAPAGADVPTASRAALLTLGLALGVVAWRLLRRGA